MTMQAAVRLRELTPMRFRRDVVRVRHALRMPTSTWRTLPSVLIIGAQRCGTSSLYKYLSAHPSIAAPLRKETEFFSRRHANGVNWYRAHFPLAIRSKLHGHALLTFEATPDYLLYPAAPRRASDLLPVAKIIVLLRNPVDRAFSHYRLGVRLGFERLTFEEALDAEASRLEVEIEEMQVNTSFWPRAFTHFSYVTRGLYAEQIRRWLDRYPRDDFLFIKSEDFFADPAATYAMVLDFLALPPWSPDSFLNHSDPFGNKERGAMSERARDKLTRRFELANRDLEQLLGPRFTWV